MPRPVDTAKRQHLIEETADYLSVNGLTDTSLRDVAAALGTTSRMLVYYFGTKEALYAAALESRRQDFRSAFDAVTSPAEMIETLESLARDMAQGEKEAATRLLIQILGAGTSPGSEYREYARAAIEDMTVAVQGALIRIGVADQAAANHARVIGAAFRGMLIDRFTSAGTDLVDATAQEMFTMLVDMAVSSR